MKLAKTFKAMSDEEIAWFNAIRAAEKEGHTHCVTVTALFGKGKEGKQIHYFSNIEGANSFYAMTQKYSQFWKNASKPLTIKQAFKNCWS